MKSRIFIIAGLIGLVLLVTNHPAQAAPLAGTVIGNQSSATYTDASNTQLTVTSNAVQTIVQQVAALTLTADGAKTSGAGSTVSYPHTLTNTGNGSDTFNLALTNQAGDSFDLTGLAVYIDADGNGVADNTTPIASTGALPAGGVFRFVVSGIVPSASVTGQTGVMRITATSTFTGTLNTFNTDTTTVTGNAVVSMTKGISQAFGNPGTGPYTYTISYTNTGNASATNVAITDTIPAGMTYVPASGRWGVTGNTVMTDANDGAQGTAPNTITYDFGVTLANSVTAVINQVLSGQSGTLTFQVNVNNGLPAQGVNNTATIKYFDGAATVGPFSSNTVGFRVNQAVGVTLSDTGVLATDADATVNDVALVASAAQGATVTFTTIVTNTGNGSDSFDMTVANFNFPAGTAFLFFKSDGVTPLLDTNGNGIPDTGPIAATGVSNVIIKATLPGSVSGGGAYSAGGTATSFFNNTVSDPTTIRLTTIAANTVNLTNTPGGDAVVTNTVNPGATTTFPLSVINTSGPADNDDLTTVGALPSGWTVTFHASLGADCSPANLGAVITNTGTINSVGTKLVCAVVSVPPLSAVNTLPGTTSISFRALSPVSGAVDTLTDAVTVNAVHSLNLTPNNIGQAPPGGSVVYSHTLRNSGNVTETAINLAATNNLSASGWTSTIYEDTNANGVLDPADAVITNVATLAAGASKTLFIKVFAPAGVGVGTTNITTTTATAASAATGSATDTTNVIAGDLSLLKEQSIDAACDGTPDNPFSTATITTGAVPGACVRYRVTVTNTGTVDALSVVVNDATPANTTYNTGTGGVAPAATTVGTITTVPASGGTGSIAATIGTLTPSQSVVVTFGVRVNP